MFINISDLTMQGDADTFLNRVLNEVVPTYTASQGFIGYYGIKKGDQSVTTIRIFEDEVSFDGAVQNADSATAQIGTDLGVDPPTLHTGADVTIASAFDANGAIEVP
jgi:hypothetical protein